jgi:hypothetical protein
MMIPSSKSLIGAPLPLPLPATLNHFKCYKVSQSRFRIDNLIIEDQFTTQSLDIRKPVRLCVPANKNDEGVIASMPSLMCYKVKATQGTDSFRGTTFPIFVDHQLDVASYPVFRPTELCVPSLISVP